MISEQLRKHKDEAAPPPDRESVRGLRDTPEYRAGYSEGFHHAMDDSIEIAEDEEDA